MSSAAAPIPCPARRSAPPAAAPNQTPRVGPPTRRPPTLNRRRLPAAAARCRSPPPRPAPTPRVGRAAPFTPPHTPLPVRPPSPSHPPQETHDDPRAIPWTELVVVFDADMQAKRNFLLKVFSRGPRAREARARRGEGQPGRGAPTGRPGVAPRLRRAALARSRAPGRCAQSRRLAVLRGPQGPEPAGEDWRAPAPVAPRPRPTPRPPFRSWRRCGTRAWRCA
jgi:hypothetical protein